MENIIVLISLLVAITIHEFCHALAADKLGDPTPRAYGRLTLNPLAHLDPLGTLILLVARFGWGKPVPIDPYNFRHPRRDEIIVALAGPLSNFLLAFIFSRIPGTLTYILTYTNLYLGIFNLFPIPPLDGSKVLLNLLPLDTAIKIESAFEHYGFILIALLIVSGLLTSLLNPIFSFGLRLLY
ncbi:MAG: Peptidase M50 [Candidatus Shapirobacteria bacterium GW2011_GWF1_38_23]|nr:MAG: Peptidase M50 [Candidatus Shapirobacteria bacterium GW2011_GWF2_37_20]KKQ64901.1 MAG: Peptidase M50 [Candidatus Shapirobacteria bacterium GW2011_GWF1_38_23]HBP51009.1 site-2 protease family protein [Candidatus Shapirobacteria bacterium]